MIEKRLVRGNISDDLETLEIVPDLTVTTLNEFTTDVVATLIRDPEAFKKPYWVNAKGMSVDQFYSFGKANFMLDEYDESNAMVVKNPFMGKSPKAELMYHMEDKWGKRSGENDRSGLYSKQELICLAYDLNGLAIDGGEEPFLEKVKR